MALLSKITKKEVCSNDEEYVNKQGIQKNSDDEVVAYYTNNSDNKVYKMPIGGNFKNSLVKKSASSFRSS